MMSTAQVEMMTAITIVGTALYIGVPALLLVYAVTLIRLRRKQALPRPLVNRSAWMMGLWLAAFVLFCVADVVHPPRGYLAGWLSVGLMGLGSLAALPLLRLPMQPRLGWPLVICGLLLTAFSAFALHVAVLAYNIGQYNNTDEPVVRAELTQNPNDAAARSSMAHIDISHSQWPDAAVQLQQWVRLEPDNGEAQFLLAHADVRTGRREEARAVLQQLADRNDGWGQGARRMLAAMDHTPSRVRP